MKSVVVYLEIAIVIVYVYVYSSIVEPSGFRVLGVVGALGDTFQ